MSQLPAFLAALVFGYLCGSIPFGIILTRLAGTQDLRSVGSGNIGATNVLRTGNKKLAAATLLGDILKGTFAVAVANWLLGRDAAICAALGAFLGHLFPVWLGFKGGKGVATFIGLLLGFGAWITLVAFCGHSMGARRNASGGFVLAARGPAVDHAPRQYRAAPRRHGKQDRPQIGGGVITPPLPPSRAQARPARRGCAGSCRRRLRRNDRSRRSRYAAATPRRNAFSKPDPSPPWP